MIFTLNFQSTLEHEEILHVDPVEFPYICNYAELNNCIDRCFPWHWHPFFELDYIVEGEIELRTADNVYNLKKGDVFFINSGVMHSVHAKDKMYGCKIYAHLFDMHFLSGTYNSLFEQKYFLPIIKNQDFQIYLIHSDSHRRIRMIQIFLRMIELNKQEPFGFEFEIRRELCNFWCMLLEETADLRKQNTERNTIDVDRLKKMMQFIHEHYADKITLGDIAISTNISTRECSRCFQRCIKISPINYLNEHRIRMAAQMLLQTDKNIITISENCGFSSSSYFSKLFQKIMGCTPKNYRKK